MTDFKDFILTTINEAGDILKDGFGKTIKIDKKTGRNNIVTEYDHKSEEFIIDKINQKFDKHNIIAEESGIADEKSEYSWIIDPLDGTVNFANNVPIFSISIALQYRDTLIAGAVYNPISKELFFAEKNKGAFYNGIKIKVSSNDDIDSSLLVTGFPYDIHDDPYNAIESFINVLNRGIPIRRLGSAALDLAYVACGRFEGFWEVNLHSWDVAAGILLIEEAGGVCTDYSNNKSKVDDKQILGTNKLIHKDLMKIINET